MLSTFGAMFTPNQQQTANELMRVCRTGGKIGMANWTPESLVGQLFKTIGKYAASPRREVAGALGQQRRISTRCSAPMPASLRRARNSPSAIVRRSISSRYSRNYYGPVVRPSRQSNPPPA